jgi:hypothetical protein
MTYRTLAWVPAVLAAVFLMAELALGAGSLALVHLEVETVKVMWLFGALAAAQGFERGDYLRRGWLLIAGGVACYLARDATLLSSSRTLTLVGGGLVAIGNASQVVGVAVLARVWRATGLDDAVRGHRRALFGAAVIAAALLTGPSIVHDVASAGSGDVGAIPHVASDLGDAVSFVLLAALVRTALALRGGVVFWVW